MPPFRSWLRQLARSLSLPPARSSRKKAPRSPGLRPPVRLRLEELEIRLVPATVRPTSTIVTAVNNGGVATFTATVSSGNLTPTGQVQFEIDGVNYSSPVNLVNGVAVINDAGLAPGAYNISAAYPRQGIFLPEQRHLGRRRNGRRRPVVRRL